MQNKMIEDFSFVYSARKEDSGWKDFWIGMISIVIVINVFSVIR